MREKFVCKLESIFSEVISSRDLWRITDSVKHAHK